MNKIFSKKDYIRALTEEPLTENQKEMLKVNYYSNNHTITASEMARLFNWDHYSAANLHYGKLGSKISKYLGFALEGTIPLHSIVDFEKPLDEWHWILHQELSSAMEDLGWVSNKSSTSIPEEISDIEKYTEGAVKNIRVNAYERNHKARAACIKHYGPKCGVCGLILEEIYGKTAKGFIQVHHKIPFPEIKKEYKVDPIKDLIPICPNCHAIIHLSTPPYTIEELKVMLKKKKH